MYIFGSWDSNIYYFENNMLIPVHKLNINFVELVDFLVLVEYYLEVLGFVAVLIVFDRSFEVFPELFVVLKSV